MFSFDVHGQYETPLLVLCTPIREEMFLLTEARNITYTAVFDDLSQLEFEVSPVFSNGEPTPYYDYVKKRKVVHAIGLGWFVIQQVSESNDGSRPIKTVKCVSAEKLLDQYAINLMDGTYKFYDALQPDTSLLGAFIGQTEWEIGHIDTELWNKYRTFEFDADAGLYTTLRGDIEDAYGCVFDFDTEKMLVNAYVKGTPMDETDIVFTFDNLIKQVDIDENDEDLVTALSVYGDNDLNIRSVNPLGTNVIYRFDYFKKPEWMTQGLIDALTAWEAKVDAQRQPYADLLARLKTENKALIKLEGELTELKADLDALEQVRTVRIKGDQPLGDITDQINAKQAEINAKQAEVDAQKTKVQSITDQQLAINKALSFEENFTEEQMAELQCYTNAATYTNDNYTITDNMDYTDIQDQSQSLYDDGVKKLEEISVPNYNFDMDVVNFMFLTQYQPFIDQIQLGATVHAEVRDDYWVNPMVVEIIVKYDAPDDCKLVFSDSFRLMDEYCVFDEYDADYSSSAKTLSESKNLWDKATASGVVDYVQDIRQNGLNLALTSVLNANDQSIVLDKFGLWGRSMTDDGNFDPEQVRLINNLLVFTDDNWQTAKAALGKIKMPDSENYAYGLIADVIIGQLVASSELVISNESNTFRVDAGGAELINAYFKLTSGNGRSQIVLDPNDNSAIRIQTDTGGGFEDKFYVDLSGNIVAEDIKTNSGTIGGWNIKEDGLYSNWGDYIRSDGYGKLSLMTYTPSSAVFDGNIYARNLLDKVQHVNMGTNSVDTEQLFNSAISNPKLQDGCVSEDKLDWEVRSLHADLIDADKILARQIGDVDNRVDEVYADVIDTRELIADEVRAREADIRELRADILEVENAIITRAEIESIVAGKIDVARLDADQIVLDGRRCGRVNAIIGVTPDYVSYKDPAITRVTLKKNGNIYTLDTSTGSFMTSLNIRTTQKACVGLS